MEYADGDPVTNLTAADGATVTLYAVWLAHTDTRYTVEHYRQNTMRDGYLAPETETLTGTTGTMTAAAARTYIGFETPAAVQEAIKADGSSVIRLYYDRSSYTVTFDGNGSTGGATAAQTFWYGVAQSLGANGFTRTGYRFAGWAESSTSAKLYDDTESYAIGPVDETLYATWAANSYTVTLSAADATVAGTSVITATYDSPLPAIATIPSRAGYTFSGFFTAAHGGGTQYYSADGEGLRSWDKDSDTTLYASWTEATDTKYTVRHLWQNVTGDSTADYTLHETEELTGTTGAMTAAAAKSYAGFDTPAVTQSTIAADGSTVVDVRYTRKTFTVSYSAGSGITSGVTGMPASPQTYRYGASVTVANEEPARSGYTFDGWRLGSDTTTLRQKGQTVSAAITGNLTLVAVWSAAGVISVSVQNADLVSAGKDTSGKIVTLTLNGATAIADEGTLIDGARATSKAGVSLSGNQLVCNTTSWATGSYQVTLFGMVNGIPQSATATITVE